MKKDNEFKIRLPATTGLNDINFNNNNSGFLIEPIIKGSSQNDFYRVGAAVGYKEDNNYSIHVSAERQFQFSGGFSQNSFGAGFGFQL